MINFHCFFFPKKEEEEAQHQTNTQSQPQENDQLTTTRRLLQSIKISSSENIINIETLGLMWLIYK